MTKEQELCVRCKKNKSTMTFAEGYMDYVHGFREKICDECYNKIIIEHPLYKRGISEERARCEKKIEDRSPEEFIENKELIELELKHLKEIDNQSITFGLVSLRALIRIHLNKYQKELLGDAE